MFEIRTWEKLCDAHRYVLGKKPDPEAPDWPADDHLKRAYLAYRSADKPVTSLNLNAKIVDLDHLMMIVEVRHRPYLNRSLNTVLSRALTAMKSRRRYLVKLAEIKGSSVRHAKIANLVKLLSDATKRRRVIIEPSGIVRGTVTQTHLIETLDPIRRGVFDVYFKEAFNGWCYRWAKNLAGDNGPPPPDVESRMCEDLVQFLLDYETRYGPRMPRSKVKKTIFTETTHLKLIPVHAGNTYQALYIEKTGGHQLERYTPRKHKSNEVPRRELYDTCNNPRYANGGGAGRERGGAKDLRWADLYVLRKNDLYTMAPEEKRFHPMLVNYKRSAGAGMIISKQGQIVGVDSESGHYEPNMKQLEQVVSKIQGDNAFADDAFVGISYGGNVRIFLPVAIFLILSGQGWPIDATLDAILEQWGSNIHDIVGEGSHDDYLEDVKPSHNWEKNIHHFLKTEYAGYTELCEKVAAHFRKDRWSWTNAQLTRKLPGSLHAGLLQQIAVIIRRFQEYDLEYQTLKDKFGKLRPLDEFVDFRLEFDRLLHFHTRFLQDSVLVEPTLDPAQVVPTEPVILEHDPIAPLKKLFIAQAKRLAFETAPITSFQQEMSLLRLKRP